MTEALRLPGIGPESLIVIFGGGGVLGAELAVALTATGARVAVVGRTQESLDAVAARCGPGANVLTVQGDVASRKSVEAAVRRVRAEAGAPTGMVNMAGVIGRPRPTDEVDEAEIATLSAVNLVGSFETVRAVAPSMREHGGGSIVLLSSVAAHRARGGSPFYGATKAGVLRLTQQFAHEFGPDGIRVNSLSPGQTPTQLTYWDGREDDAAAAPSPSPGKAAKVPLRRRGRAEDYVGPALFLLSDLSGYVTGADLPVDGGLLACL